MSEQTALLFPRKNEGKTTDVDSKVLAIEERQNSTIVPKEIIEELSNKTERSDLAPMLRHYVQLKAEYPEHILLYQVGDFYEVFFEDAKLVADVLKIRLTSRNKEHENPTPMCGVPIHAIDNYLPKLLSAGLSCVMLSQTEDSRNKKGMVRREISRIVTPGIRFEGDGLVEKEFNFLASASLSPRGDGAFCSVDVSTGHLRICEVESEEALLDTFSRIRPVELILPSVFNSQKVDRGQNWIRLVRRMAEEKGCHVVYRPFDQVSRSGIEKRLSQRLEDAELPDLKNLLRETFSSIQALLGYVDEVSFGAAPKLCECKIEEPNRIVFIDSATRRNLEIIETRIDGERKNSLLGCLDYTKTAMGSRLLSERLLQPSRDRVQIDERLDAVDELIQNFEKCIELGTLLTQVRDLDRLASRLTSRRATPRDFGTLRESIVGLPNIYSLLSTFKCAGLNQIFSKFDLLGDIYEKLSVSLVDDLPVKISEGGIIRDEYNAEVDRLRQIRREGRQYIANLEQSEKEKTGIGALKVKYNNIFGYFIEVTKTHVAKVPPYYERKQTLVNAERYVTKELKEFEESILSSKSKLFDLEKELFTEIRDWLSSESGRIQLLSRLLGELDVFLSFAFVAKEFDYCRPVLNDGDSIKLVDGRHPVVEQVIGLQNFVGNTVELNCDERRFAVLTGPNMGGKSTYLRMVGLIQLLAQAGSFVPAKSAELGLVDRIFTRIGAADDLARGDSTFMVEMREASSIIKKATGKSLVLIDEIGRGTATSDGLAIATAVAEWLHDVIRCKTIFATHFHELTELKQTKSGAFCISVGVVESDNDIRFTYHIENRAADRSYGIEVARLAGLPETLLTRAQELLPMFMERHSIYGTESCKPFPSITSKSAHGQHRDARFNQIVEQLKQIDVNRMTPLQALSKLAELRDLSENK